MSGSLVCGADGRTYQNACTAGCGKTTVATQGPCPKSPQVISPIVINKCASAPGLHAARPRRVCFASAQFVLILSAAVDLHLERECCGAPTDPFCAGEQQQRDQQ